MSPIIEIPNIKYSLCKPPLQFREPCAPILANKIQGGSTETTEGGLWEGCYSLIRRLAGKAVMPIPLLSVPGYHDTRTQRLELQQPSCDKKHKNESHPGRWRNGRSQVMGELLNLPKDHPTSVCLVMCVY